MSATKRLISGSIASWVRIGINILAQLILVPVYLTYWDIKVYGVWIAIQAMVVVLSTLDQGHQTFLEFEFLKYGSLNRKKVALILWSGVIAALAIGLFELISILILILSGSLNSLLGDISITETQLTRDAALALLFQMIVWVPTGCLGGIFVRVLSPFGYYPRMSWWGVWAAVITSVAPAVAIVFGAGLLTAGITLSVATIAYNIPLFIDIYKLLGKEDIKYERFEIKLGFNNFVSSLAISGKSLLENARQQGVRVILSPLSGAVGLVAFSTMRTGANIALQGLNTITNPLMPELMHFLNIKDQERTEASFATIWFVVIALLSPGVVILQAFIEPLFKIWTKGQIVFDPVLFALLSLGVLVYAVAQPAMSIVKGNNMLRPQLFISLVAAGIVVGGMFVLVPAIGILGAGIVLLLSEIISAVTYGLVSKKWLSENGLKWPQRSFLLSLLSILTAGITMSAMAYIPNFKWVIFVIGIISLIWTIRLYWLTLPLIIIQKIKSIISKLPYFNKLNIA